MNLGIVTPQLSHYGGSEIFLLECLRRWQHDLTICVYTTSFRKSLLTEYGIDRSRVRFILLPAADSRPNRFGLLHETVVLPRIWESMIAEHDLYFLYLAPTQLIRKSPSVWFAAEPLRMLYDLRHHTCPDRPSIEVHCYPKLSYETVRAADLEILLELIETFDTSAEFDCFATNSKATARYLENIYGRGVDRVVYPGINPWPSTSPPRESKQAISVGRLWKHKRVDLTLRALSYLPEGNLVVVGDGPERKPLKKLARELGLTGRVRFAGNVSGASLARLYAASSCCVYTPIREPFGMVPLEAAAAGRAVVATRGGGFGEILDETCAYLVPDDPEKIGAALQSIFESPERARSMGEAGKRIADHYTWDRTASSLLELFRQTAKKGARVRREADQPTRLGAHFYPWYRAGRVPQHWNENREFAGVVDYPLEGPYSSSDPRVIERQLHTAVESGLDFLSLNWQVTHAGVNAVELETTRRIFETIEKEQIPLSISILLALSTEDATIVRDVHATIEDEFMPREAYLRVRERPLLWYFLSDSFLGYFFHHLQELVGGNHHSVATGGLPYSRSLPRPLREFFQGWCYYSPLQAGDDASREALWRKTYRETCEVGNPLRVFTICPGFDDTHLHSAARDGSPFRQVPRAGGRTYRRMQESALSLSPRPDLVVVTSFNEFHENTQIEPSRKHGDAYIRATREFKNRLMAGHLAPRPSPPSPRGSPAGSTRRRR